MEFLCRTIAVLLIFVALFYVAMIVIGVYFGLTS